jgi:hypothetical protein
VTWIYDRQQQQQAIPSLWMLVSPSISWSTSVSSADRKITYSYAKSENSSHPIRNRTYDLPACSAVLERTAPLRTP